MTAFAEWCQRTALAVAIRNSPWPSPVLEIFHLTGMVLVFGTILVLNLRIFGLILRSEPIPQIARDLTRLTLVGLGVQLVSGSLMYLASAMKLAESTVFTAKITLVIAAVAYHFLVHRRAALAKDTRGIMLQLSAAVSMMLWGGVVLTGLDIGILS